MARPADPALARAIRDVIGGLRRDGWSTRQIAQRLEVADPTVIRWENGGRVPALDFLPKLDELCGRPRGYVLRLAGYVHDDPFDVETAIRADPRLNEERKLTLIDAYRGLLRLAPSEK